MGKRTASAETLKADPRHHSKLASKFINCLMWQGKKATAQRVFYGALEQIKKRMPEANPLDVFINAVENVKPPVELRSRRGGGGAPHGAAPGQPKSNKRAAGRRGDRAAPAD